MAITAAAKVGNQIAFGKEYTGEARVRFTLDSSYPAVTGGYASFITTTVKGISGLANVTFLDIPTQLVTNGAGGWLLTYYARATDQLRFVDLSTGVECTNGQDLSTYALIELMVRFY